MNRYSGKFRPLNPQKYDGDPTIIVFRSLWELSVMKWCDTNPQVISWNSEETVIPYLCQTDGKPHRYFVDFKIKFSNRKVYIVEVKPKKQTEPPKKRKKTKKYIEEVYTYGRNISKWKAAQKWCKDRGYVFQIWTEDTLKKLGIPIVQSTNAKK